MQDCTFQHSPALSRNASLKHSIAQKAHYDKKEIYSIFNEHKGFTILSLFSCD